jgi:hypothetical protein
MAREVLSTARPTPLRLVGFLFLAAGALAAGVGSTREWATVGLRGDVERAVDVPVAGTDVWEGKVVLFSALVAVLALLAIRLSRSNQLRRGLAILLVAIGALTTALPIIDGLRSADRFGGTEGIGIYVERLAAELDQPEEDVGRAIEQELRRDLRVDIGAGLWIAAAGGALIAAGGVLTFLWARRRPAGSA